MKAILRSRTIIIINLLTGGIIAIILWKNPVKPFPFPPIPDPELNLVKLLAGAQIILNIGALLFQKRVIDRPQNV
ncbi:hypothetical protein ACKW6Q_15305 [Chryseobacterium kwangjuense]|uniref:Uncharacterized protein n=1 Tax=Chryseobacterium kwangjuense TaxID=267125 RepID=A0ABW9K5D5_9FLAO